MQPARILIVDDEDAITTSLAHLLGDEGYDVQTAHSGAEGLARLEHTPFDLLLCDLMMPGLDGLGVVNELTRRGASLPILLMSVLSTPAEAPPHIRFLRKPFTLVEVIDAVEAALAQSS